MISFLKYYDGAKPSKKRAEPIESVKSPEKRRNYVRPDRTFNQNWKVGRNWLKFEEGKMTCDVCVKYANKTSNLAFKSGLNFISGSTNLKKSAVTEHEVSKSHIRAMELLKAETSSGQEIAMSRAGQALQKLKKADKNKLLFLFKNAHAVAVKNRPLSDFIWQCDLDKSKDLEIGETYLNEKAALVFIECIAETELDKVKRLVDTCPFFSFMMDGSTDLSGDEQESIYIRTCYKGEVNENFLTIGNPKSTCSHDLYNYVKDTFATTGLQNLAEGHACPSPEALSLQLQRTEATLSDVLVWVESTIEMLEDCKERQSEDLQVLLEEGSFQGVHLRGTYPTMSYKSGVIDQTVTAIKERFALHSTGSSIFAATRISSLRSWPSSPENEQDFGDRDIDEIWSQFNHTLKKCELSKEEVHQEWRLLKKLLYKRYGTGLSQQRWVDVHRQFSDQFSKILLVMDLLHSLPPTSVSCETSFSQMKLIKTSRRCRMRTSTLNTLMTVKLHAPSIKDFNPDEAIDRWLVTPARPRRLNYKRAQRLTTVQDVTPVTIESDEEEPGVSVDVQEPEQEMDSSDIEDDIAVYNKACDHDDDSDYCSDYQDEDEDETFEKILRFVK